VVPTPPKPCWAITSDIGQTEHKDIKSDIMKYILSLFIFLSFISKGFTHDADNLNDHIALQQRLSQILPQGWVIENKEESLEISGPEIRAVWPVSLPPLSTEEIWRDYSLAIQVHISIRFQAAISDKDLEELRILRDRFEDISHRGAIKKRKDWSNAIKEYGFIRLPDYKSKTETLFVHNNTDGYMVKPEASDIFNKIDAELALKYARVLK
jgi:hypothetical protein